MEKTKKMAMPKRQAKQFSRTERAHIARKIAGLGLVINLILTAAKIFAGIFGKSSAMLADGLHSLSDFGADLMLLFCFYLVSKPADRNHPYGHGRFETLAAGIIAMVLFFVAWGIFFSAIGKIKDIFSGVLVPPPGLLALILAPLSIIVKEALYRYSIVRAKMIESDAMLASAWHHRSDALSSVGTTVGIAGAYFLGDKWVVLDPLAAIIVSFFVLKIGYNIFRPVLDEFLQRAAPKPTQNQIRKLTLAVPGVLALHGLKTYKLAAQTCIEMHLSLPADLSLSEAHKITEEVEKSLKKHFHCAQISIHPEPATISNGDKTQLTFW